MKNKLNPYIRRMKSLYEIEQLKRDWKNDPCYDIENTEGFEDHYEELKAFSDKCKKHWKQEAEAREKAEIQQLESELSRIGTLGLLRMIKELQEQVSELNEKHFCLLEEVARQSGKRGAQ